MLRRSPFHVYVLRHKNNEHYQKMNKIAVRGRKREVTLGCCVQNFNEWGDWVICFQLCHGKTNVDMNFLIWVNIVIDFGFFRINTEMVFFMGSEIWGSPRKFSYKEIKNLIHDLYLGVVEQMSFFGWEA